MLQAALQDSGIHGAALPSGVCAFVGTAGQLRMPGLLQESLCVTCCFEHTGDGCCCHLKHMLYPRQLHSSKFRS